MDISKRVPPNVKTDLFRQRLKCWNSCGFRAESLDDMNDFQATHVYHDPKNVGLPHAQRQESEKDRTDITCCGRVIRIHST